jgi:hypothetical protein
VLDRQIGAFPDGWGRVSRWTDDHDAGRGDDRAALAGLHEEPAGVR